MKNKTGKYLVNVVGPTAVGKTNIAVQLAKALNTDVISFDSRQFYKEMSVGTAKPTKEEMNGVTHHFIDSHSIDTKLSAGQFEIEALSLLNQLFQDKDVIVTVGGSGLFIDALAFGLDDLPSIEPEIREKWNQICESKGIEFIQEKVKEIDPVFYEKADKNNPHRLQRVLEIYDSTGEVLSDLQKNNKKERPFTSIWIGLNMERSVLYDRINQRVDIMMKEGLLDEVLSLKDKWDLPNLKTVGYQEFIESNCSEEQIDKAVELVKRNSRRYAKRQLTWFRKNEKITWFSPDDFPKIQSYINSQIS